MWIIWRNLFCYSWTALHHDNICTAGPFKNYMVTKIVLCIYMHHLCQLDSGGLVQPYCISIVNSIVNCLLLIPIANSLVILQSCTKLSIYCFEKALPDVLLLWKRNSYGINITLFYEADANFQIIQTQPWDWPFQPVDIHNITSHNERAKFQYVPRIMHMVRVLLCFSVVWYRSFLQADFPDNNIGWHGVGATSGRQVKWDSIGSSYGLLPVWRQAITWTDGDLKSVRPIVA